MLRRAALVTLTLASCDGYVIGSRRMGTTATAKAMRGKLAANGVNMLSQPCEGQCGSVRRGQRGSAVCPGIEHLADSHV